MKITKRMFMGFASLSIIGVYLVHPVLSLIALIMFIAILDW